MKAGFEWSGLDELRADLLALPQELVGEASTIIHASAARAAQRISAAYPVLAATGKAGEKAGDLRAGVSVEHVISPFGASAIVWSKAPHAWMFEHGTEARRTVGGEWRPTPHPTGRMPATPTFIPIASEERRTMYEQLIALVARAGFVMSGDPWDESTGGDTGVAA